MKIEKATLTALCVIICAWAVKMLVSIVHLARYQDVPVLAAAFEIGMFLGAGLVPLAAVWFFKEMKRKWLYALWAPCILYVSFLAINLSRFRPVAGSLRILVWAVIIVLFIRESRRSGQPNQAAEVTSGLRPSEPHR